MSAFHAFWSIGGAAGALFGAGAQALGLALSTSVLAAAVITAVLGVTSIAELTPDRVRLRPG